MRGLARLAAVLLLWMALPLSAQDSVLAPVGKPVPFGVGERLEYQVKFGKLPVGSGSMEMMPHDTVREKQTWHAVFNLSGGIPFYRVRDHYETWFDIHTLASLRFWQDIDEGPYEPKRRFEIFPERREFTENNREPQESVEHPVDDATFLYFVRTLPLRVGMDTTFNDYFKAKANPVRLKVLRVDTISVPAGKFAALVVQPLFESKLFNEGQVWLSDDENHIMLQMKSKLSFGSLSLYLKSYKLSPTATARLNRVTPQQ